jgi:endonuclease-3
MAPISTRKKSKGTPADQHIDEIFDLLLEKVREWKEPIVTRIARRRDPFHVLISTILSLRTKDETTAEASRKLFKLATTPREMAALSGEQIQNAIFPAGFYKTKARTIIDICNRLNQEFGGQVPDDLDQLLGFKGVGRKTANLVITLGFEKPGICVDTHVHRITNRWGYVETKTPDRTEMALREKLPSRYWLLINDLLVTYGQNLCKPVSPHCSRCVISEYCLKVGVSRSR